MGTSLREQRRHRWWPEELKREIVAASLEPGSSVSVVARRYDVNANQVFAWRKRYREPVSTAAPLQLVPVTVTPDRQCEPSPAATSGLIGARGARPGSACRRSLCFRGARGGLIKIIWHDGIGMSLYAKRLEHGRFVWPSPADGTLAISAAQLAYMLDGIDWRNPRHTWRPASAG